MTILDRHITARFLANFVILLVLLFVFAVSIDLILQFDRFVDMARAKTSPDAGAARLVLTLLWLMIDFHGPRIVQFYAYMVGLLSIGAMGFTLASMYRHRELTAVMAGGISLQRVAMPIIAAAFALNLVQLLNQELIMPRVAPLLIRDHGDIARRAVGAFTVPFTRDGNGHLLQAASFDPGAGTLSKPTILMRDADGRTILRITADAASWDDQANAWRLENGIAMSQPTAEGEQQDRVVSSRRDPIAEFSTDLTPEVLTMRRFGQFASMLSTSQINQMLASRSVVDADALARFKYSRFAAVLINMLLLIITLPFFLLREPANLLLQSLWCAAVAVPGMIAALIGLTVELPGIPPAAGVFLPVAILIPIALAVAPQIKT